MLSTAVRCLYVPSSASALGVYASQVAIGVTLSNDGKAVSAGLVLTCFVLVRLVLLCDSTAEMWL